MADEEHLQKDKLFGEICNKKNWKDEIDAIIDEDKLDEYDDAVCYFTGGGLDIVESYRDIGSKLPKGKCKVYGHGYYVHVGA
tara:strand:+ start:1008 stop:1253 length:246 start_codon:yes stop_codon:yes gene_type:complete